MAIRYSDQAIAAFIAEEKQLPPDYRTILIGSKMKLEDSHKRAELKIVGQNNNAFQIMVRQSTLNLLNFSVILAYEPKDTSRLFLLRRYNGKSHQHSNKIEGNKFRDFHIHYATERYQAQDFQEEGYAEVSNRFSDLGGALNCLIRDCHFNLPEGEPPALL